MSEQRCAINQECASKFSDMLKISAAPCPAMRNPTSNPCNLASTRPHKHNQLLGLPVGQWRPAQTASHQSTPHLEHKQINLVADTDDDGERALFPGLSALVKSADDFLQPANPLAPARSIIHLHRIHRLNDNPLDPACPRETVSDGTENNSSGTRSPTLESRISFALEIGLVHRAGQVAPGRRRF